MFFNHPDQDYSLNQSETNTYFDAVLGIEDPNVFIPPSGYRQFPLSCHTPVPTPPPGYHQPRPVVTIPSCSQPNGAGAQRSQRSQPKHVWNPRSEQFKESVVPIAHWLIFRRIKTCILDLIVQVHQAAPPPLPPRPAHTTGAITRLLPRQVFFEYVG